MVTANGHDRVAAHDTTVASHAIGDRSLQNKYKVGLLCSVRCPGTVIVRTLDLSLALRDTGGSASENIILQFGLTTAAGQGAHHESSDLRISVSVDEVEVPSMRSKAGFFLNSDLT